ncbi:hypothetical protein DNTS_032292 [Danionella cerebrum]|uniref:TLDc domain-containing protein n=1 Tax=Danionella cerebrum TaxID=2873325 RepID=A0A553QGC6_9TELE|nr:hypothetical protein DNTS_032292 [Danionella translucida]TRY88993.1 hypothetical protein DNTS_032292 [Danionella translucida]
MSCKLFTDGMGVVGGVMIITPNNIMFDPHKSDPLVLENGCEEYGLICPLEELLSVALYEDVSRMSLQDALPSPSEWEELPSERDLNPFSRYQTPVAEQMKTSASEACEIQIGERSPSDEGFTELEILQLDLKSKTQTEQTESDLPEEEDEGLHSRSTDLLQSTSVLLHDEEPVAPRTRIIEEMQTEDSGAITEERAETDAQKNRRASEAEMKAWLMKRMQRPIEDMLLTKEEKSKAPPMFLCFKVGKPMRKSFVFGITSSPAHSSPSRGRQLEYWFAVPQERVEDLYWFFIRCSPDSYGSETQEQGFVLVEKEQLTMIDDFFSDPVPRSWEIITMNEIKRRQSLSFEEPLDLLPVLLETSAFLQDMHTNKLCSVLPARVQAHPWHLLYSTDLHGTSLKTLYRNLLEVERPVLLVVKDSDSQVFGAFSTHPFRVSEHYYGTGETFLFSFCPELKVFHWTGENSYFVKGNLDSLQIGGGGGRLGLWLDADLYHGTSSKCSTFNNLPLSSKQDFTVQSLEVWVFE